LNLESFLFWSMSYSKSSDPPQLQTLATPKITATLKL